MTPSEEKHLAVKVKDAESQLQCNCDLDNWEPEKDTGHSWVCRIHRKVKDLGGMPRRWYSDE